MLQLRVLITAACAAASLAAQQDFEFGRHGGAAFPPTQSRPAQSLLTSKRGGPAGTRLHSHDDDAARRVLPGTNEKMETAPIAAGVPVAIAPHGQCRFEVSVAPGKLMAGQSGTATVVMVLESDSVLESAADLRLVPPAAGHANESLLALGLAAVQPPRPSHLAAAYRGRHVYDNCVVVEIPITMAATAPFGSTQSIDLEARFRLNEGATGRSFGEFSYPLTIACEVGSVPDPVLQQRPPGWEANPNEPQAPAAELREQEEGLPQGESAIAGSAASAAAVLDPHQPASTGDLVPPPADDDGLLLIAVAAMVAVAAFALFARRR
jgi:hypothetical protein